MGLGGPGRVWLWWSAALYVELHGYPIATADWPGPDAAVIVGQHPSAAVRPGE
jgi:hypothetical protein